MKNPHVLRRYLLYLLTVAVVIMVVLVFALPEQRIEASMEAMKIEEEAERALEWAEPFYIALTFDDGPRFNTTNILLDGLKKRDANVTFFVIGRQIADNVGLIRRMEEEGHQIGIHTYNHTVLTGLCKADFDAEVEKTRAALVDVIGHEAQFILRPPYGMVDTNVLSWVDAPVILWSVDPADWGDKNVDRIVYEVTTKAQDGDIVLLHDFYRSSVDAALEIIDRLQKQGAVFVTVDELFAQRGAPLENGVAYRKAPEVEAIPAAASEK